MNVEAELALKEIYRKTGQGICGLSFRIELDNGYVKLEAEKFDPVVRMLEGGKVLFTGSWRDINIFWEFTPWMGGYLVKLEAESRYSLHCSYMDNLIIQYRQEQGNVSDLHVLNYCMNVFKRHINDVNEINDENRSDNIMRCVYRDEKDACLFAGTIIPQQNRHLYLIENTCIDTLVINSRTFFTKGFSTKKELASEVTWICSAKRIYDSLEAYSQHIPGIRPEKKPLVGWNSWDYYFSSVSYDDIVENMNAISEDPLLSKHIEYIVVDDGWEHNWGEWNANYRFPGGIKKMAAEIRKAGFIPGIWTAPLMVYHLSKTALRNDQILVRNEYGDPQYCDEMKDFFMVDPTHPEGEEFIRGIFTGLYKKGYRYFKIDYMSCLLKAVGFHCGEMGVYDVYRHLLTVIRQCVTDKSHIAGCGYPAEIGPGYVDSARIGVDIHNQWSHVEWVIDTLQTRYWFNNRIFTIDPDFLVVRGDDTSTEKVTNVLNPNAHNPEPPRWRRGPVFKDIEAKTWTNIVNMSGGCVFLGDRISRLNTEGKKLLKSSLVPYGISAKPLDLCAGERASLWLQELENEFRLTIINWNEETETKYFSFKEYDYETPDKVKDLWTCINTQIKNGVFSTVLKPHESQVVSWGKHTE